MKSITTGTKAWGLYWTFLAVSSWLVWRERNYRQKRNEKKTDQILLKEAIVITEARFKDDKFRKNPTKSRMALNM